MSETVVMSTKSKGVLAALAALTAAVIGMLTSFNAVHWSTAETALVVTEAAAFWALASAVVADRDRHTRDQPVAVAGTVTAFTTATVALGVGFVWWHMNPTQNAYLTSLVTAAMAVVTALVARTKVTPNTALPVAPGPDAPQLTANGDGRVELDRTVTGSH